MFLYQTIDYARIIDIMEIMIILIIIICERFCFSEIICYKFRARLPAVDRDEKSVEVLDTRSRQPLNNLVRLHASTPNANTVPWISRTSATRSRPVNHSRMLIAFY